MDTKSTFDQMLLESIQYCYDSYIGGKKLSDICDNVLFRLLKVTDSQFGFVSEFIEPEIEGKAPYFHHLTITNISWDESSRKLYDKIKTKKFNFYNLNTLFGICCTTKKLIISNDPANDKRRGGKSKLPPGHPSIDSFAGIPMIFKKKFVGMIGIANRKGGYCEKFIEKIKPFTHTISHIIGSLLNEIKSSKINKQINNDLEISKRTRDSFSAKVTHDIRTPIGAIIGVITLLKKNTSLDEMQTQYVNMIDSCSTQLLSLINDLLDFSKCKNGKMSVHNKPVDLKKCLEEVYDINFARANEKNLNISYIIDDNVPIRIISDEGKIKQILVNLMSNAIKFTKSGAILTYIRADHDRIRAEPNTPGLNQKTIIKFSVYDTGIGVQKKYLNDIFNVYEQIENEYNRTITGTGLGLSICKDFVELLGGEIGVNSTIGKGSEFYFTIAASCSKPKKNNCLKDKHIMIIDDLIINRMLYNNIFTEMGMITHMFSSGAKAINYISLPNSNNIRMAFIDIHMPVINGIDLARKIKKINDKIILISITADTSMKWNEWMEFSGVFDKNVYTPVDKVKLQTICIDLVNKYDNPRLKRSASRYIASPKNCNIESLWFNESLPA